VEEFLPGDDEEDGGDVEAAAAGEGACDEEDDGGAVLCGDAEADAEEVVDGDDAVIEVRLDEDDGDEETGEDGADGELGVEVVAVLVAFLWSAEECGGGDFGGEDGCEDGPPWDAAVADGEAAHGGIATALVEADGDDDGEVGEDYEEVEQWLISNWGGDC